MVASNDRQEKSANRSIQEFGMSNHARVGRQHSYTHNHVSLDKSAASSAKNSSNRKRPHKNAMTTQVSQYAAIFNPKPPSKALGSRPTSGRPHDKIGRTEEFLKVDELQTDNNNEEVKVEMSDSI